MEKNIKKIIKIILSIVTIIVIVFVLSECVLRLFKIKPVLQGEWIIDTVDKKTWLLDKDVIFSTSEFNNPDHYKTQPGDLKIVALGDSFTQSFPAQAQDTYPAQLQILLDKKINNAKVINVGMGYAGTDKELEIFKKKVLPNVKPDIVIWQVYFNDIWDNIGLSIYRIDKKTNKLVPHGVTFNWAYFRQKMFNFFPGTLEMKKNSYLLRLLLKTTERLETFYIPKMSKPEIYMYGYEKIKLAIKEMETLAATNNFHLYLVLAGIQQHYLAQENVIFKEDISGSNESTQHILMLLRQQPKSMASLINTDFQIDDLKTLDSVFPEKAPFTSLGMNLYADGIDDPTSVLGVRHYNKYGYWLFAQKIGAKILKDIIK